MKITRDDVVDDCNKSIADFIFEAKKQALKENIRANTVMIDKHFCKVNDLFFAVGNTILHIPPMICGLEIRITDELPDGYNFALIEAPETERDRLVKQAKNEAIREFSERLKTLKIKPEFPWDDFLVTESMIDDLVKEMTEAQNEQLPM